MCRVRTEARTGTTLAGRIALTTILDFLRPGDRLVVTRIDRLARSIADLQDIVRSLKAKGATLNVIEQAIDTGSAADKAFLDMLGAFAEFETNSGGSVRPKASPRRKQKVATKAGSERSRRRPSHSLGRRSWRGGDCTTARDR